MRIRALDSIRGLLLLQMTLNHFGKPISFYLYQCFGFFSAAEGFFFLSGFVCLLAATSKSPKDPTQNWMRKRAGRIWIYHMVPLVALATLAYFYLPRIAHLFQAYYSHPAGAVPLSLILVHTPEWMDILPQYVLLMLAGSFVFPIFVRTKNQVQIFALWCVSLGIWIAGQFGLRQAVDSFYPSWVNHGVHDPFCWQFIYFSGVAVSAWWKHSTPKQMQLVDQISLWLIVPVVFCFLWSHQFISLPLPAEVFISREHLGILRYADFFMFMMVIGYIVRHFPAALDFRFTNIIGRHSLDVYSSHTVLLLLWFSTPASIQYHSPWNVIAPLITCVLLWAIAKLQDNSKKSPAHRRGL